MLRKRLGRRMRIRAAAADRSDSAVGFNDISLAAKQESLLFVRDKQQGLEVPQEFISTPILGKLDGRTAEISVILIELSFKAAKEGKRISCRAGEPSKDLFLVETPDLTSRVFDDGLSESYLAISCHYNVAITAHAKDGRRADQSLRCHERNS